MVENAMGVCLAASRCECAARSALHLAHAPTSLTGPGVSRGAHAILGAHNRGLLVGGLLRGNDADGCSLRITRGSRTALAMLKSSWDDPGTLPLRGDGRSIERVYMSQHNCFRDSVNAA
jgi:hypothetical protein